ncbi:hypothetical protein QQS21_000113 [Conoideocrella luteorostrata]|uniref:Cytochrome P450 n=1 Tax=Conoideocrella luteorostrata TaxID=1105319 RepID=A0AAJ0D1K4_9HYPO|nr:hypothetical protein QQS21_000113 [Conoideocrella luteorostrata]
MTSQILPGLALLIFVTVVRFLVGEWQYRRKARKLGCFPPAQYPHRFPWPLDPWGRDLKHQRLESFAKGWHNKAYREQFRQCGPTFEERSSKGTVLCTTDDNNWRTILALKSEDYNKEEVRTEAMMRFSGPGILTNEGPAWRHSRDLIKPLFVRAELSDVHRFERHVDQLLAVIPRDGCTIDMMPWMAKLFLDNSTGFIFGESFNSLGGNNEHVEEMLAAFKACRKGLGKSRVLGGKLPFFKDTDFEKNVDIVHAFIDRQVRRALEKASVGTAHESDVTPQHGYVLLDELAKEVQDPLRLRFEMLHVFMPSFQSISNIFSHVLFYLARNPGIWSDLRNQALALGDKPLTFELLKSLHSFRNVIYETLRIHGSSGRLSRTAIRDTVVPRGGGPDGQSPVFVPKGRTVMLELYAKFNDPKVWGDDVDTFRPGRFEGRRLKWDFVAFSGGPRICPAQQQALTQMIYLLVRLVKEFEVFENRDPCIEYIESASVVSESRNGVQVALHEFRNTSGRV